MKQDNAVFLIILNKKEKLETVLICLHAASRFEFFFNIGITIASYTSRKIPDASDLFIILVVAVINMSIFHFTKTERKLMQTVFCAYDILDYLNNKIFYL